MSRRSFLMLFVARGGREDARHLHVRPWVIAILLLFVAAGIAGYFVPFTSFSLNIAEIREKQSLDRQNVILKARNRSIHDRIWELRKRIEELTRSRKTIEPSVGGEVTYKDAASIRKKPISQLSADQIALITDTWAACYSYFAGNVAVDSAFLLKIPILRPVAGKSYVTAGFGRLTDPFTGTVKDHDGADFAAPPGTPVIATASGYVCEVDYDHPHWGKRIVIAHAFDLTTVYAHLGAIKVEQGTHVLAGDVIATVGTTGVTTGPHVHYSVLKNDHAIDPLAIILPYVPDACGSNVATAK